MRTFYNATNQFLSILIVSILFLSSCIVDVPSYVIQPDEMEDVLYDYHLMQALAGDLTTSQNHQRKIYEESVFAKHNITEAQFDTSLTWYLRNTKELEAIYKNLNQRFAAKKEELANYLPPSKRVKEISPEGDSVNIWTDFRFIRLSVSSLSNKLLFTQELDSNFHINDTFEWMLNATYLDDSCRSKAIMSMTLLYDNDTIGVSQEITSSGPYSLKIGKQNSSKLKEIVGNIYYFPLHADMDVEPTINNSAYQINHLPALDLLLSDITLMRYHYTDTLSVDSL